GGGGWVGGGGVRGGKEARSGDGRGVEPERDGRPVLGRLLEELDARQARSPPLCLTGVDARDVAADVLLLLLDELLLLVEGARGGPGAPRLLPAARGIASGVRGHAGGLQVHDLPCPAGPRAPGLS